MSEPRISFVVIGLNEAEHLAASISSLAGQGVARDEMEIIYVDSSSSDGSPEIAREAGVDQVLTVPRQAANAPRGRNTGLERVRAPFVQFVDGDTALVENWAVRGLCALESDPGLVGVEGELRELRPRANLYHAVCELDWPAAPGEVQYVGGNSMYRVAPLREVGGFDPDMRVGEEPELGVRLRARGGRMLHLDTPMAWHDIDIRSLFQYLKRSYTSGVSCAMVVQATGGLRGGYWAERLWKTLAHSFFILLPLCTGLGLLPLAPVSGTLLALLSPVAVSFLAVRKARDTWRRDHEIGVSLAFGLHTYLSKLPNAAGILSVLLRPRSHEGSSG